MLSICDQNSEIREKKMSSDRAKTAPVQIVPVKEIKDSHSWVIYGKSGSGKTSLAGTFPAPILLLDFNDRGTQSVSDVKDLFVARVTEWEQVEQIFYSLLNNEKSFLKFKTIVFDTVTQLQDIVLRMIAAKRGGTLDPNRAGDWGTLTQKEWGAAAGILKDWIVNFRNLPNREIVFLAQQRTNEVPAATESEQSTLLPDVGPALMPSVAGVLNANVEVIAHAFIHNRKLIKEDKGRKVIQYKAEYCLRLGPDSTFVTKIRKPRSIQIPLFISDPTYTDIIDIIKGE
jgi:hypothetical protein